MTIGLILVGVGTLLTFIVCRMTGEGTSKKIQKTERAEQEVIAKHKATTFSGLDVVIRFSTYKTYLAIEIAWKGLAQAGNMAPTGAFQVQNKSMMPNQILNLYQPVSNSRY